MKGAKLAGQIGSILVGIQFLGFALGYIFLQPMIDSAKNQEPGLNLFPVLACILAAVYGAWHLATMLSDKWRIQIARFHKWAHFVIAPLALILPDANNYEELAKNLATNGGAVVCVIFLWYLALKVRNLPYC